MQAQNTNEDKQSSALETRLSFINEQADGLFKALVKDGIGHEPMPQSAVNAFSSAISLVKCGLVALTEIAEAQQRMAALAERDYAAEIAGAVEEAAEAKLAVKLEETNKRTFIGQKPKDA